MHRISGNSSTTGILLILIIFAAIFSVSSEHATHPLAVEAQFADVSTEGLSIVPASCPSYPHYSYECSCPTAIEGGFDGGGRLLYASYANRMINAHGVLKCVTNYTGYNYYVPYGDYYQVQSFINAAPYLGVGVSDPY
jgi:hypothetical protein